MLTKKQQIKLILLTQDPEFGHMLVDVIETWKIATPVKFEHGLNPNTWNFKNKENPTCCLLGAAFVNKEACDGFSEGLRKIFNIESSCLNFIEGFDGCDKYSDSALSSNAARFARKVGKIVFE